MKDMDTAAIKTCQEANEGRQRDILKRLKTICVGKSKVLNMLALLKEKECQGERIDRGLMQRLVESYDNLKHQEEEFIVAINRITEFTNSSTDEIDAVDNSGESAFVYNDDDDFNIARRELSTAVTDSKLASSVHNSLQNNIRLTQEKLTAMKLLYEKNLAEHNKTASAAVERRELAQLQLSQERGDLDRKQKLLERLRKKAAAKLLTCSDGISNVFPIADDNNAEPQGASLLKSDERVPPVPEVLPKLDNKAPVEIQESLAETPQCIDELKDPLRANISARFSAFEARKQRMRELRAQLNRVERRKMDSTYNDALGRLQNLTKMRQQLEGLTNSVNNIPAGNDNVMGDQMLNLIAPETNVAVMKSTTSSLPSSKSDSPGLSTATDEEKIITSDAIVMAGHIHHPSDTNEKISPNAEENTNVSEASQNGAPFPLPKASMQRRLHLLSEDLFYKKVNVLPDSETSSSDNALEFTIQRIVDMTRKWINKHACDGLSAECAVNLCDFVARECWIGFVDLANLQHQSDEDVAANRERFLSQLTPVLDELVEPMVGVTSAPRNAAALVDAFLSALGTALRNDLAFWTLLRSADALIN